MKKLISVFIAVLLAVSLLTATASADDPCMTGHDYVLIPGCDATCTAAGYSEHYECSRCGVVPDTVVIGGVALTQILEDLLGAIKTRAAVVEGTVYFTDPSNGSQGQGEPGTSPVDPGSGEPGIAPADPGTGDPGIAPVDPGVSPVDPDPGSNDEPEFSREFLTDAVVAIAGSREEDLEGDPTPDFITEEELNAAINILNDVLDLKIELPFSLREYLRTNGEVFYNTTATEIQNTVTYFLPLGHEFGYWTVSAQPSASAAGAKRRECVRCQEEDIASIVYMPGDVNADGAANLKDVLAMKKHVAGGVSGAGIFVAGNSDLDGNSAVNMIDVSLLKKMIA